MTAASQLAEAIKAVRKQAGSHDKLVKALRDRYGLAKASRTLAINWEKGSVPRGEYRAALIDLGVPAELWPAVPEAVDLAARLARIDQRMDTALSTQRKVLADIAGLAKAVDRLSDLVEDAVKAETRVQPRKRRTG